MDWNQIIAYAAKSGVFALLFAALLAYVLRDGRARETKYCETIDKLCAALGIIKEVRYDVKEIKRIMRCQGVAYQN